PPTGPRSSGRPPDRNFPHPPSPLHRRPFPPVIEEIAGCMRYSMVLICRRRVVLRISLHRAIVTSGNQSINLNTLLPIRPSSVCTPTKYKPSGYDPHCQV
ncbi:MAG: hypothetical protein R6U58_03270, partial [Bacteroidales bacterium]